MSPIFSLFQGPSLKVLPEPKLSSGFLVFAVALFLTLFDNVSFWSRLLRVVDNYSAEKICFLFSVFTFLIVLFYLALSLVNFKYILKPAVILILVTASFASYFMGAYGIMIDKTMIQNIAETDSGEVLELINPKMIYYFVFLGVLPSLLVYRTQVQFKPFLKEFSTRFLTMLLGFVIIGFIAFLFYKDYVTLGRNHRDLRHLINPVNYIYSLSAYVTHALGDEKIVVKPLGEDAKLAISRRKGGKKNLAILVVGETARAKNFSLNGYDKNTNPLLINEDVINFSNFYSCGTATAVSVPCMFSNLGRDDYSNSKARRVEGLLDVLKHAGIRVLWRDNNSGCKGVCDRVETEDMANLKVDNLCNGDGCYDEILLEKLQDYVDRAEQDLFIVLHQKGSHGPTYHLRYPDSFNRFTPVCGTNQLQDCRQEEIVNVYDNTILYTDYFLSRVIGFLKENSSRFNTSMIYVSDHGESLGENNIYLHGIPYMFAPEEQKHVPFIVWLSKSFEENSDIDRECLRREGDVLYSHDNLFHSVLGLMDVKTEVYDARLDIFAGCRGRPEH